ncbi:hypothetical protein E4633_07965 [Geomonas terrae]|uniref:DNA-binding protein n=1 Tax=Geomonas terrae TaxID=2562681 RepID=A0A4S1CFG7_9BACT|nr:hypothetical protein [Geomonas terrae]TGU72239.1 hypothetical protein E4633_07965 [Geomonas terrae]
MTEMIDGKEHVTAAEAAAELSTTETKILMLLKQKALQGTLSEQGWFITRESLDSFDQDAGNPQAQLSCRTSCSSSTCGCR